MVDSVTNHGAGVQRGVNSKEKERAPPVCGRPRHPPGAVSSSGERP